MSSRMPSMRDMLFSVMPGMMASLASRNTRIDTTMPMGMSRRDCSRLISKGRIMAVTPIIRNTLAMFEPSTLPMAMSPWPVRALCIETKSSGAEVPIPTMVRPMMKLEILAR